MISDLVKIGEGGYSTIFKYKTNKDYVFKVGYNDVVEDDYNKIKSLPKRDFYVDPDLVSLEIVSEDELKLLLAVERHLKPLIDRQGFFKKLVMPYLKGYTLYEFITKYKYTPLNKNSSVKEDSEYMPLFEWKILMLTLIDLFQKIQVMNLIDKTYHNDLNSGNIIYDRDNLKMSIVDFNSLTFNQSLNWNNNEIENEIDIENDYNEMKNNFRFCISSQKCNPEIQNFIINNELNIWDKVEDFILKFNNVVYKN